MNISRLGRTVFTIITVASGEAGADIPSKFVCRDANDEISLSAELETVDHLDFASLSLRGPMVKAISNAFTDKEADFYDQIKIRTAIVRSDECPFEHRWLYYSCMFHSYAVAVATNRKGDSERLRLATGEQSNSKGSSFDYFDGTVHSVGIFLYKRSGEQIFFGEEFGPDQCSYE